MAGINKVILVGNLGKDPEIRHLEGGTPVANFSMATSESYKDRTTGEWKSQTEWHNVVLWRGLAERAEKFLKKGSQIYLEGKIRTRSWEDKDGNTRYTTEIVAEKINMLGKREDSDNDNDRSESNRAERATSTPSSSNSNSSSNQQEDDDDLPF